MVRLPMPLRGQRARHAARLVSSPTDRCVARCGCRCPQVLFAIGECYVHIPQEEAEERITNAMAKVRITAHGPSARPPETDTRVRPQADKELDALKEEASNLQARMTELKSTLKSKFGDSINLETD